MADAHDAAACLDLRGRTRENAFSLEALARVGITPASWHESIRQGTVAGWVALVEGRIVGFSFGDPAAGEILVVAVAPEFKGQGVGRTVLCRTMALLSHAGCRKLSLATSRDPRHRSHGFYRRLGWTPTGRLDPHGDEWLEWTPASP